MKLILTIFVITVLLAGVIAAASAADVLDLSTLNKKTSMQTISLPQVSTNMPTIAPTALGGNVKSNVLDLSTLGKKASLNVSTIMIKGRNPGHNHTHVRNQELQCYQPGRRRLHSAAGHFRQCHQSTPRLSPYLAELKAKLAENSGENRRQTT